MLGRAIVRGAAVSYIFVKNILERGFAKLQCVFDRISEASSQPASWLIVLVVKSTRALSS